MILMSPGFKTSLNFKKPCPFSQSVSEHKMIIEFPKPANFNLVGFNVVALDQTLSGKIPVDLVGFSIKGVELPV